jgi:hypothetical protein
MGLEGQKTKRHATIQKAALEDEKTFRAAAIENPRNPQKSKREKH